MFVRIKTGTSINACDTYYLIFWISSAVKNKWVPATELCHIRKSCSSNAELRSVTSTTFIVIHLSYAMDSPNESFFGNQHIMTGPYGSRKHINLQALAVWQIDSLDNIPDLTF
mgnify:FL=1